ncbi:MAG TPA: asparagine synthase (glutamine-hydrolyzing) [Bacteroidia bacterium]|jgi:asparagine synthase (glutamine-hydrolysing)|nr:asparagine synthase (glutamine-hydrolyzing) [Bacteroidia bacterium]
MCGITGFYSQAKKFSEKELHAMTDILAHRGPDAFGYFLDEYVGLGHRRLSIIDLSDSANQPMYSGDKRYVMVYNGEVYNYQEIAAELRSVFKIQLKTSSDSEVILEAYARYGPAFVKKLNGMFAIAIYDTLKKELFVCRDRVGIKPLFYFWDGENFAFASELKALVACSFIPLKINMNAAYQFLHLGFVPSPISIYESIKKMKAGSWIKVSATSFESNTYWSVNQQFSENVVTKEKEAIVKLSELLMSSVQYQIKSDVPFGVFLSGGIDSSLITASAVNLSDGVKVNTFSIGFEENRFNESVYARSIANYLGTNHHEFIVSYKDALDLIDPMMETYSEPFADSSAIPTMLVSKLARQHVTVTLSGEGGDELFFGYGAYQWAKRLNRPMIKSFRHQIASFLKMQKKFQRHAAYFEYPSQHLQYSHIHSQEQYLFSLQELDQLMSPEFKNAQLNANTELLNDFGDIVNNLGRSLNPMEKQALFDLNYYLECDLLSKVDRASMRYSLETRVPYLDHRIIEFALNLSPHLKYKNGTTKYLLKEILYQYIPKKLFDRPKQGFAIPLEKWLRTDLYFLIEDTLSKEVITKYNIVNYSFVAHLKKEFLNGKDFYYNRLWQLIVLHKWLKRNHP